MFPFNKISFIVWNEVIIEIFNMIKWFQSTFNVNSFLHRQNRLKRNTLYDMRTNCVAHISACFLYCFCRRISLLLWVFYYLCSIQRSNKTSVNPAHGLKMQRFVQKYVFYKLYMNKCVFFSQDNKPLTIKTSRRSFCEQVNVCSRML